MSALATKAEQLRALHHTGTPLVLPNAWDVASAKAFAKAGYPAIATTSGGVATSLGWKDGEDIPPEEMFAAVARIARAVDVPVTADLEAGYGLAPRELVERIVEAGAAGCNIEDSDHRNGGLVDAEAQAERLAAIVEAARAAGAPLVLNARVDTFLPRPGALPPGEALAEGIRRGRLYRDAGADCLYPIFLADDAAISAFVCETGAPVNVFYREGVPQLARLAEIGVGRVTFGTGLHRAAIEHAVKLVAEAQKRA